MLCQWCGERDHDRGAECPRMRTRKGSQDVVGHGDWTWYEPPNRWEQYRFTHAAEYEAALKAETESEAKQKEDAALAERTRTEGPKEVLGAIKESWGLVCAGRRVVQGRKKR